MTLLPVEEIRISVPSQDAWPDDGDDFRCCNPECSRGGAQVHHVVRRSATGGPVRWVAVDGFVLLNEVRVCLWCHELLNIHDAWIRFTDDGWVWYAALPPGAAPGGSSIQHPKSGRWFAPLGRLKGVQ